MSIENQEETLVPEGKKLVINDLDFYIKPFVLKNRIIVVRTFGTVFAELGARTDLKTLGTVAVITLLIDTAGERLVDIYAEVLGKEKQWLLDNLKLKDEIAVIQAIFEVNELPFLVAQLHQLMGK